MNTVAPVSTFLQSRVPQIHTLKKRRCPLRSLPFSCKFGSADDPLHGSCGCWLGGVRYRAELPNKPVS